MSKMQLIDFSGGRKHPFLSSLPKGKGLWFGGNANVMSCTFVLYYTRVCQETLRS